MANRLSPNTLLNNNTYRIDSLYKEGGQSLVYIAFHCNLNQKIIIKQTEINNEFSEAIEEEGRLLSSLDYPSLPRIQNLFIEKNEIFLVMNYIEGEDLSVLLKSKGTPFSYLDVIDWMNQLLEILKYLQSQTPAIIHRDINPRNIRLDKSNRIYLLDFGIAKRINKEHLLIGGTENYTSPEQLKDFETDFRSDLYSLSASAYYLLTGVKPTDSLLREKAILNTGLDPLIPIYVLNNSIPLSLSNLIHKGMSLDATYRPANATEMKHLLASLTMDLTSSNDVSEITLASQRTANTSSSFIVNIDEYNSKDCLIEDDNCLNLLLNEIDKLSITPQTTKILPFLIEFIETSSEKEFRKIQKRYNVLAFENKNTQIEKILSILDELNKNDLSEETIKKIRDKISNRLIESLNKPHSVISNVKIEKEKDERQILINRIRYLLAFIFFALLLFIIFYLVFG